MNLVQPDSSTGYCEECYGNCVDFDHFPSYKLLLTLLCSEVKPVSTCSLCFKDFCENHISCQLSFCQNSKRKDTLNKSHIQLLAADYIFLLESATECKANHSNPPPNYCCLSCKWKFESTCIARYKHIGLHWNKTIRPVLAGFYQQQIKRWWRCKASNGSCVDPENRIIDPKFRAVTPGNDPV